MPNFIYELSLHNAASRQNRMNDAGRLTWQATVEDKNLLLENLQLLQPIAENARLFGTTLWFEDGAEGKQLLKDVVATGQFTTCINLLEYIISVKRKNVALSTENQQLMDDLMTRVIEDLDNFKKDPYFMF